jgi:bifunctional oligoribonuclease and PAP phosphatase NrnA
MCVNTVFVKTSTANGGTLIFAAVFMKPVEEIYPLIAGPARKVVITAHQKPDADAMGSMLSLKHFLIQFGHSVTLVSPTNWAAWLNWMPGVREVVDYDYSRDKAEGILDQAEWLFCLDFNAFHRTKNMAAKLQSLNCIKILIDHHREPDEQAFDYGVSDTGKSSTCEMIYDFIVGSGHADKINNDIAQCLYAGLIADTGSFRFDSTHAGVHKIVADLKERGLQHSKVHESLFDNYLETRLRFLGNTLQNRMQVFYEYNTALIAIPKSDLLKYDVKTGDTEGFVNYPLSIQGIKLAAFVVDRDEERKWSFRSKGDFDCNTFARKYFEGGGHYNAAGGRSSESLEKTVQRFIQVMKENESILQ